MTRSRIMQRAAPLILVLGTGDLAAEPRLSSGFTTLAQPTSILPGKGPAAVTGYRTARFGMTGDQVRAAVAADFGAPVAAALHDVAVEPGFTALSTIAPGIFGARTVELRYVFADGGLVAVNLILRTPAASNGDDRGALIALAKAQATDLLGRDWQLFSTVLGRPTGVNSVLVAAVTDDLGNGVNIELSGVAYRAKFDDGSERASPPPQGPAALRIVYAKDIDNRFSLPPNAFISAGGPFRIDRFRSVRFGMIESQVLPLAAHDLNTRPAAIKHLDIKSEGTTALVAGSFRIDPGPTPAVVSYIFGARSRKLVQIVVQWSYPSAATELQRQSIVEAGARLASYLKATDSNAARSDSGGAAGPNDLILYRAWDGEGSNITLSMSGVRFNRVIDGKSVPAPVPAGPALLRLAYSLNAEHPDMAVAQ